MKICFLTAFHASWTKQEVSILRELGHIVYLVYPPEYSSPKNLRGVSIIRGFIRYTRLLIEFASKSVRCDLIYCWFVFPTGVFAVLLGKFFRKPVIVNAAGYDVAYVPAIRYGIPRKWYLRPLVSLALKNATRVLAISRDTARWAEKWGARGPEVIYEGIDVDKFKPMWKKKTEKENELILLTVLFLVKRGVERKDLRSLLESLSEVINVFPKVKLVIAGKKGDAYPLLRETVERLGVENNVVFKGFVPDSKLVELYNECDIFVLPSLYESFPTACAEAQACGKPVISTDVASMPEVIRDNETGILVKPRNPKALAHAIKDLLSDSTLRQQLGRSGRKRVALFFSRELRTAKLRDVLLSSRNIK